LLFMAKGPVKNGFAKLSFLKWRDYLGLSRWVQCNYRGSHK
jgi:hypothetical protein